MRPMYLAAAAVSLIACTVEAPSTSVTSQNVEAKNRLASNRLASNRLASNRLASNRLASNALDSTNLTALSDTSEILSSPSGRIVYSYIISCALDIGQTISKDGVVNQCSPEDLLEGCVDGAAADDAYCGPTAGFAAGHCEFAGALDLTPDWVTQKLDKDGQGWISACLFSRVNALDTAKSISLRGSNPALLVSSEEAADYPWQEGAFYGNLFSHDKEIDWNVCAGLNAVDAQLNDQRECTKPSPTDPTRSVCGFKFAGDCWDFTPSVPSPSACQTYGGGTFDDCTNGDLWKNRKKYRQVITTYFSNG